MAEFRTWMAPPNAKPGRTLPLPLGDDEEAPLRVRVGEAEGLKAEAKGDSVCRVTGDVAVRERRKRDDIVAPEGGGRWWRWWWRWGPSV